MESAKERDVKKWSNKLLRVWGVAPEKGLNGKGKNQIKDCSACHPQYGIGNKQSYFFLALLVNKGHGGCPNIRDEGKKDKGQWDVWRIGG